MVWDYHVFLVLRPRPRILPHPDTSSNLDHATCAPSPQYDVHSASVSVQDDCGPNQYPDGDQAWVYDFDTTLAVPCPWRGERPSHPAILFSLFRLDSYPD